MARRPRRQKPPRRKKRRHGRRRKLLPWLGLGALGLATYWVTRRSGTAGSAPGELLPGDTDYGPVGELDDDVAVSWISAPTGTLRVAERHAEGKLAIIFVHGLAGRLEHWTRVVRGLGPGLRGIAFDLPGHGDSDPAAGGSRAIEGVAASIGAVVDAFGLRRCVVVAHSLGALGALEFARSRRDGRVAGLLLVDPSGDQSRTSASDRKSLLKAVRRDPRGQCEMNFGYFLAGARDETAQQVRADLAATSERAILTALESSAVYPSLEALQAFDGPVLCMTSELNDLAISLHRLHPELRVRFVSRASHWLMMDRPDAVLEVLWDLLEEASPQWE